jgi:hypothetical protein
MPALNLSRRTAGEGSGRTARVHVYEESGSGILPMNHSTLGRYSSAIRAACANERSCGSARGAISDDRPCRDRQLGRQPTGDV